MKTSSLKHIVTSLAAAGLEVFERRNGRRIDDLVGMCVRLVHLKGEASAISLAHGILSTYDELLTEERIAFFERLLADFMPDKGRLEAAIDAYREAPDASSVSALHKAAESPRQELFRLLNVGDDGTARIIRMREHLHDLVQANPKLLPIENDLLHLLQSWFNHGFLELKRIDWQTPAIILEKLIEYESVHEIRGWDDLRRRLAEDRRCFAFFHPVLPEEPLIFVEIALVKGLANSIQDVLSAAVPEDITELKTDTAVFYSINNCQRGLVGVSFGNLLIKQVTDCLADESPNLKHYATLSPIPGFMRWLSRELAAEVPAIELTESERELLTRLDDMGWVEDPETVQTLKPLLMHLCACYLLQAKSGEEPRDPVARFHLRNGARLERINWLGDRSEKGLRESAGMLVNYIYDRKSVARNHEAYVNEYEVATSSTVEGLSKKKPRLPATAPA